MLHLAVLKFSPRMVSLDVLCVPLLPLCPICWLFFLSASTALAGNSSKVQNLAFCIFPQYSPLWTVHQQHDCTLQRYLKTHWLGLNLPNCDSTSSYWPVISSYDPWHLKRNISEMELISSLAHRLPAPHTKPSSPYAWVTNSSTLPTSSSTIPTHHVYCCHFHHKGCIQNQWHVPTVHCIKSVIKSITNYQQSWKFYLDQPGMFKNHHSWLAYWHFQIYVLTHTFLHTRNATLSSVCQCMSLFLHRLVQNSAHSSVSPISFTTSPLLTWYFDIQFTLCSLHLLICYLASALNLCHMYTLSLSLLDYKTLWKQRIALIYNNILVLI